MVEQKVVIGVFRHAESKSGRINDQLLGKTRQSDFPEYTPLLAPKSQLP